MRIRSISVAALAAAALVAWSASAFATTITKDSDGLVVGANFALLGTNNGTVSMGAAWGTVNCSSSSFEIAIDTDGTIDVGDVMSASFGPCVASFGVPACVYPDNIASTSAAITYNAGADPVHDFAINATRDAIVINPVDPSCPVAARTTHQSSGCTYVVAGTQAGAFDENADTVTLSNGPGLTVVSKTGTGFLCFSVSVGAAYTFNGSYELSPGTTVGP